MIKNWQLFLENLDDDDAQLLKNAELLKSSLKMMFGKIFLVELFLRASGDKKNIQVGVDLISETLINMFGEALARRGDFNEEFISIMTDSFSKSIESSKKVMVEKSFADGLDVMVDTFVKLMMDIKKSWEMEGEEWKQEKERDYSELSKSELNSLIDKALDDRDFAKVKFLSQYLKESVDFNAKQELNDICFDICDRILQFVVDNNLVA